MPTVLITGTSRGLGLELTRQYLADGWNVLAGARDPSASAPLQALAAQYAATLRLFTLDVEDHTAIDQAAHDLEDTAIDVLINSAGTMGNGSFAKEGLAFGRFGQSDFEDWARVFRINVAGPMKMAEAFVEHVARSQQKDCDADQHAGLGGPQSDRRTLCVSCKQGGGQRHDEIDGDRFGEESRHRRNGDAPRVGTYGSRWSTRRY